MQQIPVVSHIPSRINLMDSMTKHTQERKAMQRSSTMLTLHEKLHGFQESQPALTRSQPYVLMRSWSYLTGAIDSTTTAVGVFTLPHPLTLLDKSATQKLSKEATHLIQTAEQMDVSGINRTLLPQTLNMLDFHQYMKSFPGLITLQPSKQTSGNLGKKLKSSHASSQTTKEWK